MNVDSVPRIKHYTADTSNQSCLLLHSLTKWKCLFSSINPPISVWQKSVRLDTPQSHACSPVGKEAGNLIFDCHIGKMGLIMLWFHNFRKATQKAMGCAAVHHTCILCNILLTKYFLKIKSQNFRPYRDLKSQPQSSPLLFKWSLGCFFNPFKSEPHTVIPKKMINLHLTIQKFGLPWWLRWRIHLQCRRPGLDPWIGKIPRRREWPPTPAFLSGESHGQRSPVMGSQKVRHDWTNTFIQKSSLTSPWSYLWADNGSTENTSNYVEGGIFDFKQYPDWLQLIPPTSN